MYTCIVDDLWRDLILEIRKNSNGELLFLKDKIDY